MTREATFHVQGGTSCGWGPTPGLALRRFWRTIEHAWIERGDATDVHFLPRRRFNKLWLRHFATRTTDRRLA